uniref:Uncharacterized protein n=1 Tax=viral metagenome TaxID=1070528 RepID=A0A6C0JC42_9ZZZZ
MGNLCFSKDSTDIYNKLETCYKCDDSFYYRKPRRRACRVHDFDVNGYCLVCHKNKGKTVTCYHIKKVRYWGLFDY